MVVASPVNEALFIPSAGEVMTAIHRLEEIRSACDTLNLIAPIEAGFAAYSRGEVIVPPVGELCFELPPGDTHIKYGYIKGEDSFVIKIASGFYDNPKIGLPSNSGLMLVFSQKTGALQAILLDEGYLTDVRTAVAGQIAAKHLAPQNVSAIGVFGTGIQARMQATYLKEITECRTLIVWGQSQDGLANYQKDMEKQGFCVETTPEAVTIGDKCNLIVTTTPSREPLLTAEMIRPGTHITAMGSDSSYKQDLDPAILEKADIVVADSASQCRERGEIAKALTQSKVSETDIAELGSVIMNQSPGRTSEDQISVADLTGVAVQDIQIATAVFAKLSGI